MDETRVESWDEFEEAIGDYLQAPAFSATFAFRGQANSDWTLRPSLLRLHRKYFPVAGMHKVERLATEHFIPRAKNYAELVPKSDDDWLAWWQVMQHYGVPTRVLDWTRSAFVATYFAVQETQDEANGGVYFARWSIINQDAQRQAEKLGIGDLSGVDFRSINSLNPRQLPPLIKFIDPWTMTNRMVAQQGMHSVCLSPLQDHGKVIRQLMPDGASKYFGRVIIPHSLKREFADRLHRMNITAGALFPGMDGLGRETKEYLSARIEYIIQAHREDLESEPEIFDQLSSTSQAMFMLSDDEEE